MIGAVRAGIAGMTIGQRVAGALLLIGLWLAPAAAVWLYAQGKAGAARELGAAEAKAECAERNEYALAQAMRAARAEWERTQTSIDARAESDAKAIADDLGKARKAAARITKELTDHAKRNPLPPDCRADPERVRLYDAARRSRAAEG